MLKNRVIKRSKSAYTANVVVVGKKDEEDKGIDHLYINFEPLNKKTLIDRYLLPIIAKLLRLFLGCKYYMVIDLKAAYWQVSVRRQNREKTAFRISNEYY